MKYRLWACLLFLPMVLWASGRPKVAVVLSGGGAKGTAHIGALKVIEEAGIPIDYVVGTSMGAIVGRFVFYRIYPAAIGQYGECPELEILALGCPQS